MKIGTNNSVKLNW